MDKLKEIVFGFIVIVALGVIFVPMLFTDEGEPEQAETIPAKPAEEKVASIPPEVVESKSLKELKETKGKAIEAEVAKQPIQEEVKKQPLPEPSDPMIATAKPVPVSPPVSSALVTPPPETPTEPKKPEEKVKVEPVPVPVPSAVPVPVPAAVPVAPEPEPTTEKAQDKSQPSVEQEKPAPKPKHKAVRGWVVQVGTFAVHDNAKSLVKKLKRAGFPAYTKGITRGGQNLTIVFVGPHSNREAATETLFAIESQYGLSGEVLHFSPAGSRMREDNR